MSRYYLITLAPVDKFFFGGEMKFSTGIQENGKKSAPEISYIIKSGYFPQQTSLLGMMRFFLLRHSKYFDGNKIIDPAGASELIGVRSFSAGEGGGYGRILRLSECFIREYQKNGNFCRNLFPAPLDSEFNVDFSSGQKNGWYNGQQKVLPILTRKQSYPEKKGYVYDRYLIASGSGKTVGMDKVFAEDRRMGISRDLDTGMVGDNALYKQVNYRFARQDNGSYYVFAFYVEMEDSVDILSFSGETVSVGADNSMFRIGIEQADSWLPESIMPEEQTAPVKISLTSPSFIKVDDTMSLPDFAITETVPFRHLNSDVRKTTSYNVSDGGLKQSSRYDLFSAGSVFYFSGPENVRKFVDTVESAQNFRQIGYNQYRIDKL